MTKSATRKKQKEVAELKRKAKAKEKLTKSGPPSKRQKLIRELKKEGAAKQVPAMMKKGGEVTSEYRGGGIVNLGNYKGQF